MRRWLVVALVGCGGRAAPPVVIANHTAAPAAATCADAGAILRGRVDSSDPGAGPARETAIAGACQHDRWSAEIVKCVASASVASTCLDRLSEDQRAAYDDRLQVWAARYGGDEYGGEMYGGIVGGMVGGTVAGVPFTPCEGLIHDPTLFPPVISGNDPTWSVEQRNRALVALCNDDSWEEPVKVCIKAASDALALGGCLGQLDPPSQQHVTAKLAEIAATAAKIEAARKKPASIACGKVVATYYGEAAWKGQATTITGKDRAKMIGQSRDLMLKACTADAWDEPLRACVVIGGGSDCFATEGQVAWTYPASGVMVSTGIPECDAYGAEIVRLAQCGTLPPSARDAMVKSFQASLQQWTALTADQRSSLSLACKTGSDAIKQAASTCP